MPCTAEVRDEVRNGEARIGKGFDDFGGIPAIIPYDLEQHGLVLAPQEVVLLRCLAILLRRVIKHRYLEGKNLD